MTEKKVCVGCGIALQSIDMHAPGYVPSSAIEKENPLCRRCFRIRNYGDFERVVVSPEQYQTEVSQISNQPGQVFYVLDVFDISGSLLPGLYRFLTGSITHVVVNKVDLLPPEVNPEALEQWIRETLAKIRIIPQTVFFVSAEKGTGFSPVKDVLARSGNMLNYVVGMANVGKSTFLNRVLQEFGMGEKFTVSRMPGTTIGLSRLQIPISLNQTVEVVDTPGLIYGDRIIDRLCDRCLKVVVPRAQIRPRVFQLNPGQTLWLAGFARFDFEQGVRQPFVVYVSNELPVHRTKLERADQIGELHQEDILRVPCTECQRVFPERMAYTIQSNRQFHSVHRENTFSIPLVGADLVVPGLGWITLFGQPFIGKLWVSKEQSVTQRSRLIGDVSRTFA